MSIVRSLLVKIGFVTDKQAVNSANKAVDRFKLRFALIASAATYAFSKVTSFFNGVANRSLDASDLAKKLNVTLSEIIAIQKAAANFRLSDKDIAGSFSRLNKLLFGLRTQTNLELNFLKSGLGDFAIDANETVVTLFQKFLVGLKNVASESERIRLAENIFGEDIGGKIAEIATNLDKFNKSVDNFIPDGKLIERTIEDLKAYTIAVNELTTSWESFATEIGSNIIPIFTRLLNLIKRNFGIIEFLGKFQSGLFNLVVNGDKKGITEAIQLGSKALDPVVNKIRERSGDLKNYLLSGVKPVNDYIQNRDYSNDMASQRSSGGYFGNSANIEINNEFIVPTGSFENQDASFITESMKQAAAEILDKAFGSIQYNNPQVE